MRVECFNIPTNSSDGELHYCGYENVEPTFSYGPHVRDCFLIHYIIKGEGFYRVGDKVYPVNKGDIFAIFPGEIAIYETSPDNPWTFCWFGFGGKRAAELLQRGGITKADPVRSVHSGNSIPEYVNGMIKLLQSNQRVHSTKLLGYLYLTLAELEDSYIREESQPVRRDHSWEYIERALWYIEYNYFKALTIQSIADFVGLERTYFSKLFSKNTGSSPQSYLMKYRIEKAITLMKTTSLSLKEIGKCVGIEEEYYFSRLFRKITGHSPRQFKAAEGLGPTN